MLIAFKELDDPGRRLDAAEKICQYIHPKRKAIEHSGVDGEDIGIRIIVEDYGAKK